MRERAWARGRFTPRRLALFLAGLHFVLAATASVLNPLGEAPDEADHWAYVVFLATEQRLPEGPQMTQSKHPPAYHASAALIAALAEPDFAFLRANPDVSLTPTPSSAPNFFIHTQQEQWPWRSGPLAFHLARLWTALLSAATVLAAYGLTRAALPHQPGLAVMVAAIVAFLPEFVFLGGALNNDTPAALWATLSLWGGFAIAQTSRLRAGWWTPLALGLGLLTKVSTAALWPIVAATIIAGSAQITRQTTPRLTLIIRQIWQQRQHWLRVCLLVFVPALLIAAPWFWRNWQLYNDPLGMEFARQTIDQRTTPWTWADTRWLVQGWFLSFWGKFGAVGHLAYPGWIYALLAILSGISLLGLIRHTLRPIHLARSAHPITLLLFASAVLAVAAGIWRYSLLALGTDQGRLLFPAVAPLLILFLVGLQAWIPPTFRRTHKIGATGLALLFLAFTLYGLIGIIRPAYAPPAPASPAELAQLPPMTPVQFGELILVGVQLAPDPILYWQAISAPVEDWRSTLRVVAEDGSLVWEWRRSPGAGRWSTDRWPPQTILRDLYIIQWPEWAGPGRYGIEVGLSPYSGEFTPPMPINDPADAPTGEETRPSQTLAAADATDFHPYHFLGWIER